MIRTRIRRRLRRLLAGALEDHTLSLSVVLIVYDMPEQARKTVQSLLPEYQQGCDIRDYEVLIVENASNNTMSPEFIRSLPANFSYHLRQDDRPTPVHAINHGIESARGRNVCVMIDGARLLTPGVIRNLLRAHRVAERAVVTVPGYHLGRELQQTAIGSGYGVDQERALMASIAWPENGYRLFDIACFSGSCVHGFYLPHSESNCISMSREIWSKLGGYDIRFDKRGGGLVNLDTYRRAFELPDIQHVFLHGEGTFHQFHGGVTTGGEEAAERQRYIDESMAQYQALRGQAYESPTTDPLYLGELSEYAQRFVHLSSRKKLARVGKLADIESTDTD